MLNDDFKELLSELSAARAEYLVVGAYALAAHGLVRATGDLDVWVRATPENARRVHRALLAFGAPADMISESELHVPDLVFQIGVAPARVDVLTGLSGLTFEQAWPERITVDLGGLSVPVLGREQLILNKRSTGRAQDMVDVQWLEGTDDSER